MGSNDRILIIDNSDHRQAGGWFAAEVEKLAPVDVVRREDLVPDGSKPAGVIISGSERSVFEDPPWLRQEIVFIRDAIQRRVPLFGVCFGHQLIFRALYGKDVLTRRPEPEVGWPPVELVPDPIFEGAGRTIRPYNFHFDEVPELPDGWELLASSDACRIHAARNREFGVVTCQFHPEVTPADAAASITRWERSLADYGSDAASITAPGCWGERHYPEIIQNFVRTCGCGGGPK
ncbi:MAG: type 1 glutamine amidotransferase [Candidatus Zixiibacteriota bacterium]|jgi:GMP synthase-like glutamine amidotransferase